MRCDDRVQCLQKDDGEMQDLIRCTDEGQSWLKVLEVEQDLLMVAKCQDVMSECKMP